MAAPNKQPFGARGGMSAPNEHDPHKSGVPSGSGRAELGKGLPAHGAPKPVGKSKKNPLH